MNRVVLFMKLNESRCWLFIKNINIFARYVNELSIHVQTSQTTDPMSACLTCNIR